MNGEESTQLSIEQERALLADVGEVVVARVAPEELFVFAETVEEFLDDPDRVLSARARDEAVGFGLDLALVTPYVLAIVGPVLTFLLTVAAETIKEGSKTVVGEWVRRLFKPKDKADTSEPGAVAALTSDQARRVREIAYQRASSLGLPADRAALLADAVVGGVQVAG